MRSNWHILWFLVSTSDAIADVLIAIYFLRLNRRFGRYLSWMMIGVSIEAVIAASSLLIFWPTEAAVMPAFAIYRTIGRTIKMVFAWIFYAYLFYWMNGDMNEQHQTRV